MESHWRDIQEGDRNTCDKAEVGWSHFTEPRCGKPLVKFKMSTCNCGKCDMSISLCEEHYQAHRSKYPDEERQIDLAIILSGEDPLAEPGFAEWFADRLVKSDMTAAEAAETAIKEKLTDRGRAALGLVLKTWELQAFGSKIPDMDTQIRRVILQTNYQGVREWLGEFIQIVINRAREEVNRERNQA